MGSRVGLLSLGLLTALSLVACSPIQGYPGPELPPERVATFMASYSSSDIDLDGVAVAGVDFVSRGVTLLPGPHDFTARGIALGETEDCDYYGQMDYSGFKKCREKASDENHCNCYDYLEIRKRCYRQVRNFTCDGSLNGEAGKTYTLSLRFDGEDGMSASVSNEQGSGGRTECRCSLGSWRMKMEDSSEGRGQGTAIYRG